MDVNRIHRPLKLITLLRSGRGYDADSLAERLGVSRRTVFRDLKMLERAGVPYRFDHERSEYSISDAFFLPPLHLELEEAAALLLMTRKLLSQQVHPFYRHALNAALKIESSLPASWVRHCGELLDGVSIHWPPTSSTEAISDIFQSVQQAVAQHVRISVKYDSVYDGDEIDVMLEPLRIVFMSRGWYLIANSLAHREVRTFKIDRMIDVQVTDEHFKRDAHFTEDAHFGAAWCMIPEGRIYSVRLRFSAAVATSVEEVRWHGSQTTKRLDDDRLLFQVRVDGLGEIASWILSYGDQVEVLAPRELRDRVRQKASRAVALAKALDNDGATG